MDRPNCSQFTHVTAMQTAQRDATLAALQANESLQKQLELVRDQIEHFLQDNAVQAASVKQLRAHPSTLSCLDTCNMLCVQASTVH